MNGREEVDSVLKGLIGKRIREIATDALETMKKAPKSTAVKPKNADDGDGSEKTLEEHDKKHHSDGYKGGKCSWREKHGLMPKDDKGKPNENGGGDKGKADEGGKKKFLESDYLNGVLNEYAKDVGISVEEAKKAVEAAVSEAPDDFFDGNGMLKFWKNDDFKSIVDKHVGKGATGATGASGNADTAQNDNGGSFSGIKNGKIWKDGIELAPTFQEGGTKSKYREMRNKFIRSLIEKGEDGTYDLETGKPVSYDNGAQVSFQTTSSEDGGMSDEEYDKLVDSLSKETGSKPHLGSYGVPEISFRCDTLEKALELGRKYNQESVFSWSSKKCIPCEGIDKSVNSIEHLKEIKEKEGKEVNKND